MEDRPSNADEVSLAVLFALDEAEYVAVNVRLQ
jgi:hypothetical protein